MAAISPVAAIPMHGTFSGTVTGTNGWVVSYPLGTLVTGSYGYDSDLLNGNHTSYSDPSVFFQINMDGLAFAGYTPGTSGLGFSVDANGMPVSGSAGQLWDLYIGSGGFLSLISGLGPDNNRIIAQVTYNTPVVPDAGTTIFLLGMAWVSLVFVRHFLAGQAARRPVKVKAGAVSFWRAH